METKTQFDSIKATGGQVLDEAMRIIHEGNVRHVTIRRDEQTIVEFPLTVGVVGAVLAPTLAAVGAVAALVTECTIAIQREDAAAAPARDEAAGTEAQTVAGALAETIGDAPAEGAGTF
jgi:hypothetical protein